MAGGEALVDHRAQHEQAVVAGVGVARPVDVGVRKPGGDPHGGIDRVPVRQDDLADVGGHPRENVGQGYGLRLTLGPQHKPRRTLAGRA